MWYRRAARGALSLFCAVVFTGCPGFVLSDNTLVFKAILSECPIRISQLLVLPLGAGVDDVTSAVHVREFATPLEEGTVILREIPPGVFHLGLIFDVGDGIQRLIIHNIDMDFTGASSSTIFNFVDIDWRAELRMSSTDCNRALLDYFIEDNLASNGTFTVSDAVVLSEPKADGVGAASDSSWTATGYAITSEVYRSPR